MPNILVYIAIGLVILLIVLIYISIKYGKGGQAGFENEIEAFQNLKEPKSET